MKLVIAYIRPESLPAVKQALYEREIFKISVTNALGCGQQKGYHETYRGADIEVTLLKKVRLEIAVNNEYVAPTVEGIIVGAKTGNIGDGKIFIQNLEECIRIRTGEEGNLAIG
ncbi:MAG: P-II family nitrogen regulator [Calditrichota bacterium]|jgi:nitrogen regulatory protein P-II 2